MAFRASYHVSALDFSFCKMFKVWTRCLLKNPYGSHIPELRGSTVYCASGEKTQGGLLTVLDPGSKSGLLGAGLRSGSKEKAQSTPLQPASSSCALRLQTVLFHFCRMPAQQLTRTPEESPAPRGAGSRAPYVRPLLADEQAGGPHTAEGGHAVSKPGCSGTRNTCWLPKTGLLACHPSTPWEPGQWKKPSSLFTPWISKT